jgi:acid phosphatase
MRTTIVNAILLGSLCSVPLFNGCSSAGAPEPQATGNTGTVGLNLQVGAGITLNTVSYTITGPNGFSRTASIDVTNSATISAVIGGLPFGAGYSITLNAHTPDSRGTCVGSATFDIDSATTKQVSVHLACDIQPDTGSILVNGTVNACPRVDSLGASPAEISLGGGSITLNAAASDADHAPSSLIYTWTSTSGTISNPSSTAPSFTCTAVGTATVTVAVSDGDSACATHQSVSINCSEPLPISPIKHVIVLIGENRTFDHVFGTYVPRAGQTVSNVLSKGIVNADGSPGPNFALGAQAAADPESAYYVGAAHKTPYDVLPPPTTGGAPSAPRDTSAPFNTLDETTFETDLDPADLGILLTGATGLSARVTDIRVTNAAALPNGPFQLTGPTMPYDAYTGDTTHRFYQMWQQSDCALANATSGNPVGCLNDLFPFVITSFSTANNGVGNSMAFFNIQNGDAPLFKSLADTYAMSDNFHQSFQGGTGANHSMVGFGDAVAWTDGMGNAAAPPANIVANPDPKLGTNNNYTVDGNFSNCSDPTQPGVGAITNYLSSLPYHPNPNCAPNTYYYLNNTNPAYQPNGDLKTTGSFVPPTIQRSIGDTLSAKSLSWKFYGGAYNRALAGVGGYCQICNPFEYQTQVMADPAARAAHIQDTLDMYADIVSGKLPSVSFAHPDGTTDGHPQSSKLGMFEAYVKSILNKLHANPALEASTLVIVTFDEGGGYWDSGFIQPVDFFGDGPRIPMIAISPYSQGGRISHSYADQVSILKFIERNWQLPTITERSRDNLPNPMVSADNAYAPVNSPALSDLFDLFDFGQQ